MNAIHQEAIAWVLGQRTAVIPLMPDKRPDFKALSSVGSFKVENGKTIGIWDPYQKRLPTLENLHTWFTVKQCNLGIVTGWNGLVVIDFDDLNWYLTWRGLYPGIKTRIVATPRPGMHVYFKVKELPKSITVPGIEVKAAGHYVMAMPSVRPDGVYSIVDPSPIKKVNRLEEVFPGELLEEKPARPAAQPRSAPIGAMDPWQQAMLGSQAGADPISAIKARFTIRDFVPGPYEPKANGTVTVHCPITRNHKHGDKSPSAFIRDDTQSFFCHTCNGLIGWDVINLYAALQGLDNRTAIRELARML